MKDDGLYADIVNHVITTQSASISMIQRKFFIGFSQAAGYLDEMQALGIVSAPDSLGRRTVLVADESGATSGIASTAASPALKANSHVSLSSPTEAQAPQTDHDPHG